MAVKIRQLLLPVKYFPVLRFWGIYRIPCTYGSTYWPDWAVGGWEEWGTFEVHSTISARNIWILYSVKPSATMGESTCRLELSTYGIRLLWICFDGLSLSWVILALPFVVAGNVWYLGWIQGRGKEAKPLENVYKIAILFSDILLI